MSIPSLRNSIKILKEQIENNRDKAYDFSYEELVQTENVLDRLAVFLSKHSQIHDSHCLRFSDSSYHDFVCDYCGYTENDQLGLFFPCSYHT